MLFSYCKYTKLKFSLVQNFFFTVMKFLYNLRLYKTNLIFSIKMFSLKSKEEILVDKIMTRSGRNFKNVEYFINSINKPIFCKYWYPNEIKGLLMLLHGYGEHSMVFDSLAKQLSKLGLLVFSHDHFSFGENPGNFGDIVDYKQLVADACQHAKLIAAEHSQLPMYLFGNSMGGSLAVILHSKMPEVFKGLILSSPMLAPNSKFTPLMISFLKYSSNVFPRIPVAYPDHSLASRDQAKLKNYLSDPLIYSGPVRLRCAYQIYLMAVKAQSCFDKTETSILIMHGTSDQVCSISGSKNLIEKSPSNDKILIEFDEARHCLLLETNDIPKQFIENIVNWLNTRL